MTTKRHSLPRRLFRYFRIGLLACVLLGAGFLLWFNYVGLPSFVQRALLDELRQHHFDLQFGKIRLQGFRHFVAENITFKGASGERGETRFHIENAELLLNSRALRRGAFQLEALDIRQGTLQMPLRPHTNSLQDANAASQFVVENISTRLELGSRDTWKLENFRGETLGLEINVSGSITNVSRLVKAPTVTGSTNNAFDPSELLGRVSAELQRFEFKTPPRLFVRFTGDAKNAAYASAQFTLRSSEAKTSWGEAKALELTAGLHPDGTNLLEFSFLGYAEGITGPWGQIVEPKLTGTAALPLQTNQTFKSQWVLNATSLENLQLKGGPIAFSIGSEQTPGTSETKSAARANLQNIQFDSAKAEEIQLQASLYHPTPPSVVKVFGEHITNRFDWMQLASREATNGQWSLHVRNVDWEHSHLDVLSLDGTVIANQDYKGASSAGGFWNYLTPYQLAANLKGSNGHTADLQLHQFSAEAVWKYPTLSLLHLNGQLGSGKLTGTAELNVPTGKVDAAVQTTFDPADLAPMFSADARDFLKEIQWQEGPILDAQFGFTIFGTNATRSNLIQDATVSGKLSGGLAVSGINVPALEASFQLTNNLLTLPRWSIRTDFGTADGTFATRLDHKVFDGELRSGIDPAIARELAPKELRPAFEVVGFPDGYSLAAKFSGSLTNLPMTTVEGSFAATNFMVRDERFSLIEAGLRYTNGVVSAHDVLVRRGKEELKAEMLYFNPDRLAIYVTNAVSTMNPWLAMSLVEDEVYDAIDPYRFETPPFVKLNGWVPLDDPKQADIVFDIKGTNFHYWRFNAESASAIVYWRTNLLSVTNVQAKFYGGTLDWEGHFKFNPDDDADYRFVGITKNADLKLLMADLVPDISMEGTLNGRLVVTHANTDDWKSWNGYGEASLKNGLLWSIPVFGMFSPALDAISPGLGTSKISEGSGTFRITNSVITTRDMEMRAPAFRLKYVGKVDFDGNVDASMQAQLFRDATLIGKPLSVALWPVSKVFEGKITGKLDNPKRTLRHFNFILGPIRSILSLKDMLPQQEQNQPAKGNSGQGKD